MFMTILGYLGDWLIDRLQGRIGDRVERLARERLVSRFRASRPEPLPSPTPALLSPAQLLVLDIHERIRQARKDSADDHR